jgi:hypothetical protein
MAKLQQKAGIPKWWMVDSEWFMVDGLWATHPPYTIHFTGAKHSSPQAAGSK